jgi:hypothetical protein
MSAHVSILCTEQLHSDRLSLGTLTTNVNTFQFWLKVDTLFSDLCTFMTTLATSVPMVTMVTFITMVTLVTQVTTVTMFLWLLWLCKCTSVSLCQHFPTCWYCHETWKLWTLQQVWVYYCEQFIPLCAGVTELKSCSLFPGRVTDFSLYHNVQNSAPGHPTSYSVDTIILCQGLQWLGHEADHSPLYRDEVKSAWSYRSTPPHIFITWCSNKQAQNCSSVILCCIMVSQDSNISKQWQDQITQRHGITSHKDGILS